MLENNSQGKKSPECINKFFDSFKEWPDKVSGSKDLSSYEMDFIDDEFEQNPSITRNLFNTAPKTTYSSGYPIKKRLLYQNDFEDDEEEEDEVMDGFLNLNKKKQVNNPMKTISTGSNFNSDNKKSSSINLEEKLNSYSKQILQDLEESNKKKELEEKILLEKKNMSLEESIQNHANGKKAPEPENPMVDIDSDDSDYSEPLVEDLTQNSENAYDNFNQNYDTNSGLPSPNKKLKTEKDNHYLGYSFKGLNPMSNPAMMNNQAMNRQNNSGNKIRLLDEISTTNKPFMSHDTSNAKFNSGVKSSNDKRKGINDSSNINHGNNKLKN